MPISCCTCTTLNSLVYQEKRAVRVFIEDRRQALPMKWVESMELSVLDKADSDAAPGKWYVSANELLSRLQDSNTAIEGESIWHL